MCRFQFHEDAVGGQVGIVNNLRQQGTSSETESNKIVQNGKAKYPLPCVNSKGSRGKNWVTPTTKAFAARQKPRGGAPASPSAGGARFGGGGAQIGRSAPAPPPPPLPPSSPSPSFPNPNPTPLPPPCSRPPPTPRSRPRGRRVLHRTFKLSRGARCKRGRGGAAPRLPPPRRAP